MLVLCAQAVPRLHAIYITSAEQKQLPRTTVQPGAISPIVCPLSLSKLLLSWQVFFFQRLSWRLASANRQRACGACQPDIDWPGEAFLRARDLLFIAPNSARASILARGDWCVHLYESNSLSRSWLPQAVYYVGNAGKPALSGILKLTFLV